MNRTAGLASVGVREPLRAGLAQALAASPTLAAVDSPLAADIVLIDGFSPEALDEWAGLHGDLGVDQLVVLLSLPGVDGELPTEFAHLGPLESSVVEHASTWVTLRCSAFGQEVAFNAQYSSAGACFAAWQAEGAPWVDLADVVDLIEVLHCSPERRGAVYDVTGPAVVAVADALEALEGRFGAPPLYMPLSVEDHAAATVRAGFDDHFAMRRARYCAWTTDPEMRSTSGTLEAALGRPPAQVVRYLDGAFAAIAATR